MELKDGVLTVSAAKDWTKMRKTRKVTTLEKSVMQAA